MQKFNITLIKMNKKGNMYPGVVTWNPIGGTCYHGCTYCSTKSLMRYPVIRAKYSGPVTLYHDVLKKCPGFDKTVFVCAQNDLFANNVPVEYVVQILQRCRMWENTYLFQTKNPANMKPFATRFPEKTILCTTIETNRIYAQMGTTPSPIERASAMEEHRLAGFTTHVTIEPIMDFDLEEFVGLIKLASPVKVNIGADSKNNHLPEPSKDKLIALINELKQFTVIDRKSNLKRILGE